MIEKCKIEENPYIIDLNCERWESTGVTDSHAKKKAVRSEQGERKG